MMRRPSLLEAVSGRAAGSEGSVAAGGGGGGVAGLAATVVVCGLSLPLGPQAASARTISAARPAWRHDSMKTPWFEARAYEAARVRLRLHGPVGGREGVK